MRVHTCSSYQNHKVSRKAMPQYSNLTIKKKHETFQNETNHMPQSHLIELVHLYTIIVCTCTVVLPPPKPMTV